MLQEERDRGKKKKINISNICRNNCIRKQTHEVFSGAQGYCVQGASSILHSRVAKSRVSSAHGDGPRTILAGGQCDDSVGYFVEPCIVETKDPQDPIMKEVTGREGLGGQRLRASSRLTAERSAALPGACLTPGESRARPWAQAS